MARKSGFLDKFIQRLDRVEPGEVQSYLVRLAQDHGLLERVFDALQEGVIVTNLRGEITYINRAACQFFGLDAESVAGIAVEAVIHGLEWKNLIGKGEGQVVSRDLEVFYPDRRFLNFYLTPLEEQGEREMSGYVMLVRDITLTRKLAEEEIESERLNALTMLAASVAHEIGNPLNSLNIHLQVLERKLKKISPDAYAATSDILEVARGEITRLDFIIDQFLRAIRPTKPQLELQSLNTLVTEATSFLKPELEDRCITTRLILEEKLPMLRVDGDQMKQAFYNLIKNAFQAMGTKGRLTVTTESNEYEVRVIVSDTGKGITRETMGRIFEPYYTTKASGTGLGLLIVRRIVREHGGELGVTSEAEVGTTITIHLPRGPKPVRMLEDKATTVPRTVKKKSETVIDV
ncbi:MAG: PAS domain S-box protein [Verrucomicrobiae bacterium]|nr:PAS domain S-box protein [Verrucomicrobiae bacterium]